MNGYGVRSAVPSYLWGEKPSPDRGGSTLTAVEFHQQTLSSQLEVLFHHANLSDS